MSSGQTLPMMPWFARDYIAATRHLSLAERGAYTDLLFLSWEMGPLPNDPVRLARLIGVTAAEFKRVWSAIEVKFTKTPSGLVNERLEKHRTEAAQRSDSARASAVTRWEREREKKRNANASTDAPSFAHANGHANVMLPSPSPSPSPYTNPNPKSVRTANSRPNKPESAAVLLAQSRNDLQSGEKAGLGSAELEAEAATLRRVVLDELSRGASAESIIRLMPGRGLTEEHIATIAREAAS